MSLRREDRRDEKRQRRPILLFVYTLAKASVGKERILKEKCGDKERREEGEEARQEWESHERKRGRNSTKKGLQKWERGRNLITEFKGSFNSLCLSSF
mmetsp:Transcript_26378/g.51839  ORF Transcript_26378/g.51839 Transcript_26378/m.51839 type:complete len:98 (+) Transcript_26378:515-808(+)